VGGNKEKKKEREELDKQRISGSFLVAGPRLKGRIDENKGFWRGCVFLTGGERA